MISAFGNGEQWERAERAFMEMREAGLQPDTVTYSALISAFSNGEQWEKAERASEEMQEAG